MKHAEIFTGGMALILSPTAGASHNCLILDRRDGASLAHTHVFNRIIMSTELLLRTNYL